MPEDTVTALAARRTVVCPTLGHMPGAVPPPQLRERLLKAGLGDEARSTQVADMHAAGVAIVPGTDGGISPGKAHGILPFAIEALVDGGVAPADALATATSLAAVACGLGDRKGHIRAGYDADLIIVDADPLFDIRALSRLNTTVLAGKVRPSHGGRTQV